MIIGMDGGTKVGTAYIGIILLLRVVQNFYTKKVSTVYPTTTGGRAKYPDVVDEYIGSASLGALPHYGQREG